MVRIHFVDAQRAYSSVLQDETIYSLSLFVELMFVELTLEWDCVRSHLCPGMISSCLRGRLGEADWNAMSWWGLRDRWDEDVKYEQHWFALPTLNSQYNSDRVTHKHIGRGGSEWSIWRQDRTWSVFRVCCLVAWPWQALAISKLSHLEHNGNQQVTSLKFI